MQTTSVISCSDSNRAGIRFTSSSDVALRVLTIVNCGFNSYISEQEIPRNPYGSYLYLHHRVSLFFVDINTVTLECVSVQNSSGNGLVLVNAFNLLIRKSSFANNGASETFSGNALIVYDDQLKRLSRVLLLKSNFSLGFGYGMSLWYGNNNKADVIIENSMFSNNIAQYGGGVDISLSEGGSIEFSNCTIYNNTAWSGGGVDIYSYGNGSIEFSSCTIHSNTAEYKGGGLDIRLNGNDSIKFSNCTIYNNIARYDGGGVDFYSYRNDSIEFSSCIKYNNTAWYDGGGVDIHSYGNGSIDFSNCTIYNNLAWYDGGGVDIHSYGSGSIDFSNCTIYNNTAWYDGGGLDIRSYRNGSVEFSSCTIYNNLAWYDGGGVDIHSYGNSSIDFSNCTIYNNTAWYDGGGVDIRSYRNGSVEFSSCTIYNNTAWYDGGGVDIHSYENGSIDFSNCTIYNNSAWYDGGGVDIRSYKNASIEFISCTIYNNLAWYDGGGVDIHSYGNGSIDFSKCTIYNNTAWYDGGGLDIRSYRNGSIDFSNCTIYNNTAWYDGGGVDIRSYRTGSVEFSNCTIYNNIAWYDGGGLDIRSYWNGSVEFSNCAIYNNTAQYDGGGLDIRSYRNGSIELSKCTIYNNIAWYDGGGVDIHSYGDGSIEFIKCTIYNNIAWYDGGGVDFYLYGNGSIEFSNCTIYNNIAWYDGGGLDIHSYRNGSIEFNNCTIYNNIAWYDGGGVDFYSYGDDSIDFSNCTIYNNTALYNGGGADIRSYGNGSIEFTNCTIYSNTAQYEGGGLDISSHRNGNIEFSSCTIYNNIAQYDGGGVDIHSDGNGSIEFSSCALYNNTAQYDGRGVEIFSYGNGTIEFNNCILYNNTAQYDNGGGILIHSYNGSININFFNCAIYKNNAQYNGGGVYIKQFSERGNIAFINCNIYCNSAQYYGGGVSTTLYAERGSNEFSNCTISNNTAYAGSGLVLHSFQATSKNCFHFTNVSFHFNKVINNPDVYKYRHRSAVVLINITDITFDQIEVSNHNSTGLVADNSLITFDGHNMFVNNSGIYGGAIALYDSSQLLLNQNTNISFVNNHASVLGGGMFVSQVIDINSSTNCTIKVIPHHYPNDTKTLLYFVNNTADISGDVLYGGKIDDCTSTLYFDHLFHYPQQTGLSVVTSDPIQVCFCESHEPNCSIKDISIIAIPGIDVNISLATVGLKDTLTEGVIKLNLSDYSSIVQYNDNRVNANCTYIIFKLITNPSLNTTQVYATLESSVSEPLYDSYAKVIKVTIEPCPNGYPLENDTCVCRSELNSDSITCDNNTLIITRDGDMWIGYENDSNCLIVYPNCPFDYCNNSNIRFTLNYHSKQCLHNRDGVLCGQCYEGFSLMLGSNQCGNCTNDQVALIIPFALAGIALIAFVITLNLTVSVGTINGLIFYANVVKIYEHILFPKGPIPFLSWFISWVNLDLGINTCFYHGMDSCSKAWLQFVFPVYVWLILLVIIILLRYSSKMVRLVGRQIIPVIATMILLSYTKLIRTVVQALYFIEIPCGDDKRKETLLRWYFDANVQFLKGCHLSLFLFSLTVLILLIIPYTFYLLSIPLFEGPLSKYMCYFQKLSTNMKPFFDAYGGPYKDNCRFWTGFLLLVRVILALVVSLDNETTVSLDLLTSILIIIVFMYLILKGIYRHFPLVCLEEFFILNLIFMAYMNAENSNDKDKFKGQVSSIVLVLISFVVFCGIILYHVWDRLMFYHVCDCLFKSRLATTNITKVKKILNKPPPSSSPIDMELPSMHPVDERKSTITVISMEMKRESILFDQVD